MKPAWSVILLTTLTGTAQGLFLAAFIADLLKAAPARNLVVVSCGTALVLLAGGLLASFFHLGRPERAWRAIMQWRTSWLSREVIVLPAFMGAVAIYGCSAFFAFDRRISFYIGSVAALLCVALFVCTAMIYACLKFIEEWHSPLTLINYTLLGTASGFALATAFSAYVAPNLMQFFAWVT